jgi:cysteinyl-tRNA synthetase
MQIYNSITRKKEELNTIEPETIKIYCCGITPYDSPHLGHALTAFRANLIRNYLSYKRYNVTYVENVTDIEDKIIRRAKERGEDPNELSSRYLAEYHTALGELGINPPDNNPKVSEYIEKIIEFIKVLVVKKSAYVTDQGSVYFDVTTDTEYGHLSNRKISDLVEGERVEIKKEKKHPLDFALWKKTVDGSQAFPSPWGDGRPGWHIECSVMSTDILGAKFDLHLGGLDLIFPHHENEVSQCRAYYNHPSVNYWLHLGLLQIEGTKMSKSLGNFVTIRQGLDTYGSTLLKMAFLRAHYRSPLNLCDELFDQQLNHLVELFWVVDKCREKIESVENYDYSPSSFKLSFEEAMDDDFNIPVAMATLQEGLKKLRVFVYDNKSAISNSEASSLLKDVIESCKVLMIDLNSSSYLEIANECLRYRANRLTLPVLELAELESLYEERQQARAKKDFAIADAIREKVSPYKISLLDANIQKWRFEAI